jgi:hypothetical protein
MANINTFLLRDMLSDNGKAEHHQYCSSPDLICHPQVKEPKAFFKNNYDYDVTKSVNTNSRTNPLYVRGKNLTNSQINGRIQVYRAGSSLFMTPSIWKDNKLYTAPDENGAAFDYVKFSADPNGISVGETPFVIDGTQNNFCLVGIASDNAGPVIPQNFTSYDSFVQWVTSNPGVCVRNLNYYMSGQRFDMEIAARIMNPESRIKIGILRAELFNMPRGTFFEVRCEALGCDVSATSEEDNYAFLSNQINIPNGFDGFFTGYVKASGVIPVKAKFQLEYWYIPDNNSPVYSLGIPAERLLGANNAAALRSMSGQALVFLGGCAIQADE